MIAEIESAKQDRGDRLYWVESLESIEIIPVETPQPMEKIKASISLVNVSETDLQAVNDFLLSQEIEFSVNK